LKSSEIEIEILPSGQVLLADMGKEQNDIVLEIVKNIAPNKYEEVKAFFDNADKSELILGDRIFCG
jgi:hypothetical protein